VLGRVERDVFTEPDSRGSRYANDAARARPAWVVGQAHSACAHFDRIDLNVKLCERLRELTRAAAARYAGHAQRNPAKICRRSGKSQFRNVFRATLARVANDPPRKTR